MYKRAKSPLVFNLLVVLILTLVAPSAAFAQGLREGSWRRHWRGFHPHCKQIGGRGRRPDGPCDRQASGCVGGLVWRGVAGLAATSPTVTGETRLNPNSSRSQAYLSYLHKNRRT